ncbi:hypothetical protein J3A84_07500 [Proteiniclasticum sp. SCR006]|uniref:Exonuclease domain-containing protein n=1 Tax=Proteiniclasticum aestuarii TaxID=2817862 RepID=A0A939KKP2_9CLOT|nr:exonuclease domain-containing protein [Proteiniclasticum aestuarii]MBO1264870.1 hypothetical protein [Proteiniclasticum aestuarii]
MKKITYFDVEYANPKNKSICQLGLLCEDYDSGKLYYPEQNLYLNPQDGFDDICVKIHGISFSKVKDKPFLPEVWSEIEKYFTNTVVVGHNVANADLNALARNLKRYSIDIPEFYYICTLDLAKKYVPPFTVENYRMGTLCKYFDIDIDLEHDAFADASANANLFRALVNNYDIYIEEHIRRYDSIEIKDFEQFMAAPLIRKAIIEFYGMVKGFSIDNKITITEANYIRNWRNQYCLYTGSEELASIIDVIDRILDDGVVTLEESFKLQSVVGQCMDIISKSPVTLGTQVLNGIMKGIIIDGKISTEESENLRSWLSDNSFLSGHHPYDEIMCLLEEALADSLITEKESEYITESIQSILNPIEALKVQVNSVEGKHVCLSGNFAFGSKTDVSQYIVNRGGIIDNTVKKSTNILLIGNLECQSYSNGTYGSKVIKAIEYNQKGCNIQIVKEIDLIEK